MSYLKERIKHAVRFRHKRGFGVHSPFMFNLILNVIRDKGKCFVYPGDFEKDSKSGHRERKTLRLLFRLNSYLNVRNIHCFGADAVKVGNYLRNVPESARIEINVPEISGDIDFIYIGRNAQRFLSPEDLSRMLATVNKKKVCIVVTDIYRNSFASRLWRQFGEKATVKVDMMWYGILFFDDKLQKGKYNLII